MTPPEHAPIGLLGGTFDPIHYGHLRLAVEALQKLQLAKLRLIPAGQPPHRELPGSSAHHRLQMTRLATSGLVDIDVDDAEVLSDQASYTVLTLERLRRSFGAAQPLVLIVGADAFLGLPRWHRWQELFELAHIAVATRPGFDLSEASLGAELAAILVTRQVRDTASLHARPHGSVLAFEITPLAISATAIRTALGGGESPRFLLPDAVLNYIQKNQLYLKH